MVRMLKRWTAIPLAVVWLVIYLFIIICAVACFLVWLTTGVSKLDGLQSVFEWLFEDYWDWWKDWADIG